MKFLFKLKSDNFLTISPAILILVFVSGFFALPSAGQQILLNPGAYLHNEGAPFIKINNGDFVNNGTYVKDKETVTLEGNTAKTMSGSSNTSLYNLEITNTGGITADFGLLTSNDLTIGNGSRFTIGAAKEVTVDGILTNSAGISGLQINSGATGTASLIHNSHNVPATVQRYVSGAAEAWHFLSSPVSAQEISGSWVPSGTYGNGTGYDLYLWNEPNNCWIYKLDITSPVNWNTIHSGTVFTPGRGYLYSVQAANQTKEFTGNLNNGSVSCGLTNLSSDVNLTGFILVGNPYPSSVDWQSASGWTRSSLVSGGGGYDMWIWNPAAGNYGACNSSSGSGTNGVTRYIAPMQGYFVRAAGAGNLVSDNPVRVHNGSGDWKSDEIKADRIGLVVKSATDNSFDEVRIQFGFMANQTGTAKLFSPVLTAPSLYIPSGGANFTVQYLTSTTDHPAIPIMLKVGRDGGYSLQGNFDANSFETVILEDRKTKTMQDLKTAPSYQFTASKTDDANRFILHFASENKLSGGQPAAAIFTVGSNLIVDLAFVALETDVTIYDAIGRKLFQQKLQGGIRHTLNFYAGTRLSIVTLRNQEGSFSRKILGSR